MCVRATLRITPSAWHRVTIWARSPLKVISAQLRSAVVTTDSAVPCERSPVIEFEVFGGDNRSQARACRISRLGIPQQR